MIEVALNEVVVMVLCASPSQANAGVSVLTVGSIFSGFFGNAGRGFRPVKTLEALIGVNILPGLNVDDEGHCAEDSLVVVIRCVRCIRCAQCVQLG